MHDFEGTLNKGLKTKEKERKNINTIIDWANYWQTHRQSFDTPEGWEERRGTYGDTVLEPEGELHAVS